MSPLLLANITVTFLLYMAAMLMGLWSLLRGPHAQDRVLALDFLYTVGMLVLVLVLVLGSGAVALLSGLGLWRLPDFSCACTPPRTSSPSRHGTSLLPPSFTSAPPARDWRCTCG